MDGDGTEDAFEFNLTRVLESLDQRGPSLGDLAALSTAPEATPGVSADGSPLLITPLSDDQPESLAPLPHRVPTTRGSQQTRRAPRAQRSGVAEPPAPEPLPTRAHRAALDAVPEVAPPARSSVFDAAAQGEARAALHRVPVDTDVAAAAADPAPLLPSPLLPAAAAAAPPEAAAAQSAVKMPTASEVRQFQSTQRRQARKNSQGRVMGRVMLVLVLFAAAVAAALTVGRDYLFPNDWAAELDEPVAEVQAARGVEFEQVVPLVDLPADEYAATLSRIVLGDDPPGRIAVWRALGVASGEIDPATLGTALVAAHPAVYDVENAEIVRLAGASAELRPLLATALDHQLADPATAAGFDLLAPLPVAFVAEPDAVAATSPTAAPAAVDPAAPAEAPAAADSPAPAEAASPVAALPVTYQTLAAERLATALAATPTASLGDALGTAPEAALAPGDVPLAGPFALGIDDWTLVWGNRLPADSVDTLVAATTADSVRTFERAGTTCVGAVFEAGNDMFAAALLLDLGAWAAAAPVESQATVTQLAPTYVQLTTCDPGAAVTQTLNPAAVDSVVTAQLARIAAAPSATAATTIPAIAATTTP
jgi:hypothetical protein